MKFRITYQQSALADLRNLPRHAQVAALNAVESILSHHPGAESKSRIKRLRNLAEPGYRLRVGDLRVFYSVARDEVTIHGFITKEDAEAWLKAHGTTTEQP